MSFQLKGVAGRALAVTVSTVITVLVFEVTLRLGGYMPEYALRLKTLAGERGIVHIILDEQRLYRVKGGSRQDINSQGYRDRDFSNLPSVGSRLLVVGDSFIMGNNLELSQTIPKQLEAELTEPVQVLNFGVSGYGPDQELLSLENDGLQLKPTHVLLSIFAGNDFRDLVENDLIEETSASLTWKRSNLVTRALPLLRVEILLRMVFQKRYLPEETEKRISASLIEDKTVFLGEFSETDRKITLTRMRLVLTAFRDRLKKAGIPLTVVIIPSLKALESESGTFENEAALADLCEQLGLSCLSLTEVFKQKGGAALYDPAYRHLNAEGARLTAEQMANYLRP